VKSHVYWNLHKNIWSIRQDGRVTQHRDFVVLEDVSFHVQPAGRERVRKEGKKNVHAYASGNFTYDKPKGWSKGRQITYNPYKFDSFVYADDLTPVHHSGRVAMFNRKVYELEKA